MPGKWFDVAPWQRFPRSMQITRVPPRGDDAAVQAVRAIERAAAAVDAPLMPLGTHAFTAARVREGSAGEPHINWLAYDDAGRPVGFAELELPYTDNRHVGLFEVTVHPDARRAGIGRAMLEPAMAYARAADRTLLIAEAAETGTGADFAKAAGATCAAVARRSYHPVADADPALAAALRAEAEGAATGYELVRWIDMPPPEYLPGLVDLYNEMNDAPTDDLRIEDEVWDAERTRAFDRAVLAHGRRMYVIAVRHRETGALAGYTQIAVDGTGWGYQNNTAVLKAHRGHRLGLWLKAAMAEWIRAAEPDVRNVLTWNARSNQHMLAVNDRLGYVEYDFIGEWELPLS